MTGASGNVGAGVLWALALYMPDAEVIGVCRRPPTEGLIYERVRWHAVDLSSPKAATELAPAMRDADVVVHLALSVQPVRDEDYLYQANVLGTQAVLRAMELAGVHQLVYASSLGIYAPGAKGPVSESWPDTGQASSTYSRHKVIVERILDHFVAEHPETAVARFRPTVVVQRDASWLFRTLYLGPFVPRALLRHLRSRGLPVLPLPAGIALQFVHADDVGDAVVRMIQQRAEGSFNIAADILDSAAVAGLVKARPIAVKPSLVRGVVTALSRARLVGVTPGWYDIATNSPIMDTTKARTELGWAPLRSSTEAARELIDGLADGAVGASAATGLDSQSPSTFRRTSGRVHDATLALWTALAVVRAAGFRRARALDAVIVAANLASGTPMALDRVREQRRDPVALAAPLAVAAAVAATWRGGWAPVVATAGLHLLNARERARTTSSSRDALRHNAFNAPALGNSVS
ncbi:MAG: NAD-dependent epimerase/dehydratase family protein [Mycobacterium sp.]